MLAINSKASAGILKLICCAYFSQALALASVLFEMKAPLSVSAALCVIAVFLYQVKLSRKLFFELEDHFDEANKIVRINLIVCIGAQLVFIALGLSGISLSPNTSISFGALGVIIMFGCVRIFNSLTFDYLDKELSKLEANQSP